MERSKPNSYQPPYPAFQQDQVPERPDFVMAMLGVQSPKEGAGAAVVDQLLSLCKASGAGRPSHIERAQHVDAFGHHNDVLMPYWALSSDMDAFFERADVTALLGVPMTGDIGLWAERLAAPTTALDANNARPDVQYGISRYSKPREEQYHAYMGSMRDRVPDYLEGKSNGEGGALSEQPDASSKGNVLTTTGLPDNLCFIRGAFAWQEAGPEEQAAFKEKMWPVYRDGAEYLRDNPVESGCISMRMAESVQVDEDNGLQSEILGWFITLEELERWTRYHPRHLAIMKTIYGYMEEFNFQPKLHLGHEVVVVPKGRAAMVYNNCHPKTGFLPFFPAETLAS